MTALGLTWAKAASLFFLTFFSEDAATLGGATLARVTVNGADFNGADLASTMLIEPIGLDAAKNFDKAQNIDRLLRE